MERVAVVGCGLMGSGIAEVCARAGVATVVLEVSQELLERGQSRIIQSLSRAVAKGKLKESQKDAILERIQFTTRFPDLATAELVVEAITENLQAKLELFRELEQTVAKGAIFASNTSNLSITEMAAATSRPQLFGGMHFFSPVPLMKLVEVIPGLATSAGTLESLLSFARQLGKEPIVAKDTCGFVVNVLLVPYLFAAVRLVENGVALIPDIDKAMKLGCRHPMGPLELLDFVGNDTSYFIGLNMFEEFKTEHYAAPPLLKRMVLAGLHGRKTGKGFYDYTDPKNPVPMQLD
ncbi:MAG: 3-hydroxybutyryl-CoA dehydrogenase [Planctomycetota bacterium]